MDWMTNSVYTESAQNGPCRVSYTCWLHLKRTKKIPRVQVLSEHWEWKSIIHSADWQTILTSSRIFPWHNPVR
jgi:hypothetical protein